MSQLTRRDGKVLLASALKVAQERPRFGDTAQLEALAFIRRADTLYEHMRHCLHCQNWEMCPQGYNLSSDFEVQDAAWALLMGEVTR